MMPEIDESQGEFKDHLCLGCGDPCDCDFRRERCEKCLKCQADGLVDNMGGNEP